MKLITTMALLGGLAVLAAATPPMNGAKVTTRVFNDFPGSTLTVTNNFPSDVTIDDQGLTGTGFANRHMWALSADGGATAFVFHPNDFFSFSFDLTLTGSPISPRKEAGFMIDDLSSGIGQSQFIVNTDAHEVVAFGGPFFAFPATYNSGDTLHMGLDYYLGSDGRRKVNYHAGALSSGELDITNTENSLFAASGGTVGGYLQVVGSAASASGGTAHWGNISYTSPVPEPATMVGLAAGLGLLIKRRRSTK